MFPLKHSQCHLEVPKTILEARKRGLVKVCLPWLTSIVMWALDKISEYLIGQPNQILGHPVVFPVLVDKNRNLVDHWHVQSQVPKDQNACLINQLGSLVDQLASRSTNMEFHID